MLIFYILLLRFSVFLAPFRWTPSGEGVFSEIVYTWIGSQQFISQAIAILLLLLQGFFVNVFCINHRLSNETTLFPGVFYVLMACFIPDFLYLSPVLLANTFFLIALNELFVTYKNPACADRIFNAGFWTGVASLFYFPYVFFLIVLIIGHNILRAFNFRELSMILTGMFMPYLLTALYFFWFDQLDVFWEHQFGRNIGLLSVGIELQGWDGYLKPFIFFLLTGFVIFNNSAYLIKKNIQEQKKVNVLYWVLVSAGIAAPFQTGLTYEHFLLMAPTLGIFLALSFTSMKHQWAEAIHFLLLVVALSMQFVPWLL
jgi:hypothetical protein